MVALSISSAILAFLLTLVAFRSLLVREWVKSRRLDHIKGKTRYLDAEL